MNRCEVNRAHSNQTLVLGGQALRVQNPTRYLYLSGEASPFSLFFVHTRTDWHSLPRWRRLLPGRDCSKRSPAWTRKQERSSRISPALFSLFCLWCFPRLYRPWGHYGHSDESVSSNDFPCEIRSSISAQLSIRCLAAPQIVVIVSFKSLQVILKDRVIILSL